MVPSESEATDQPVEPDNLIGQTRFGRQVRGTIRPAEPAKSKAKRPKVEEGEACKMEGDSSGGLRDRP